LVRGIFDDLVVVHNQDGQHVVGAENAVVVIETMAHGVVMWFGTEMPLADRGGLVICRLVELTEGQRFGTEADVVIQFGSIGMGG